ncbi:DUF1499 domain-containing protein [Vibrio sp. SCSIO 43137]|uniref:DUF1499 domain-containing protein n=1 Tax=Vibrio sp. SCSIO 43137 TaxID=3021011 RepID=UPI002307E5C3|nr:DUF1499 domain-containing protein [Vibrio sp. SCSIO 43137]WCE31316.1 DUF1499 domain-containing protein [Vibrio sp. SCSIO 43137]
MIYKIVIAVVLALVAYMFYKNSVTPSYLGVNSGKFAEMPSSPNAVSSQTDMEEKFVEPLPFQDSDKAIQDINRVLSQMSGNEVVVSDGNYLHVVFTTPTMKYKDDLELYLDDSSKQLHYRSQSRVGYSDAGLNRARYDEFAKLYQKISR